MKRYVYLLSTYDEYGAENVIATLDRDKLPELLKRITAMWPDPEKTYEVNLRGDGDRGRGLKAILTDTDEKLAEITGHKDVGPDGHNLTFGWGGVQLHVVPIE